MQRGKPSKSIAVAWRVKTGAVQDEKVKEGEGKGFRKGGGAMNGRPTSVTDLVRVNSAFEQKFAHAVVAIFDGEHQKTCFTIQRVVEEGMVELEQGGYSGDVPGTGGLDQTLATGDVYG